MALATIAIIGRPNVGKSTLFNRILRRQLAVTDPTPGVTRDRNYAVAEWGGRSFLLVDTGGLVPQSDDEMQKHITAQSELAIAEADRIVFLVDCQIGIHPTDEELAAMLQKSGRKVLVAANKADGDAGDLDAAEFANLGLGEPLAVSATAGRRIGDLLDWIIDGLPESILAPADEIAVAVIGRPNVGKSSFVNKLLDTDRHIVTDIPGTTRDSVDSRIKAFGKTFVFIDTAGLRRKARIRENIEFYTTLRTIKSINRADVVCLLFDASLPPAVQDFKIAEYAAESGKGLVFLVNKWDLVEKDEATAGQYVHWLEQKARTFAYVPVVFISALTGQRVHKVFDFIQTVAAERTKHIKTQELTETIMADIQALPPPAVKGKYIKIPYVAQAENPPPTFVFFCNYPKLIREPYERYITNRLRERFGFIGVPIRVRFRKKGKDQQ
jgi:GTP-binding protein